MGEVSYKALGDAIERLREALVLLEKHHDDELRVTVRDSALLSFQFTFALCRPMIERFLVNIGDDPQIVEDMSFPAIIRSANERGALREPWLVWRGFREARNKMAHVYSETVSDEILLKVPAFLAEAEFLYRQVTMRGEEE